MKLLTAAVIAALSSGSLYAAGVPAPKNLNPDPYRSSYNHSYRHGVMENINTLARIRRWEASHASTRATDSKTLSYGGGTNGVGVMSGQNKVYLVFYGSQWGASSTDANGNLKFTVDPSGVAGVTQQMFKGIGTNNETWQNDLTQWCNGAASGATSCGAGLVRIPRQANILAGVWYDNGVVSPKKATAAQLANAAIAAAAHFGNTTAASNRSAYYIILSPHTANPDDYQGNFCAWHDYTADAGVTSPYGELAFSNQPYNTDSGSGCGVNFLNSGAAGALDGWTMTLGHEWHEMMSDQFPSGGWSNQGTGTDAGMENSDECAWIPGGQPGGGAMITFSTGSFAEQSSWSNDTASCAISHDDVSAGGGSTNNPPTANYSFVTTGLTVNFTDTSTDSDGTIASHAWDFGDGATSTAANPSHTYAAAGTYTVVETVKDNGGASAITAKGVVVTTTQLLKNTGFETTGAWTASAGVICSTGCSGESAHSGSGFARLDGQGTAHTDTLLQKVSIPAGMTKATLQYYLHVDTAETTTTAKDDTLTVGVYNGPTLLKNLATFSNLNAASGYVVRKQDVSAYIGQTVTVKFIGKENPSLQTSFVLDDVTLTVQ